MSLLIFPVKTRLRRMVEDAILDKGLRALRNWLHASPETRPDQRPLVLVYDEDSGGIQAKFAEPWRSGQKRIYA